MPNLPAWSTTAILLLGCVVVPCIARRACRPAYPLPPGPPGIPWVGNVIGVDTSAPWKTYAEWARTYGDIIHTRLFGKDVIIINSEKVAKDLLEDRSRVYSDRPYLFTAELCGLDFHTAFMTYGDEWRLHRRFFHQTFRLDAVPRFWPLQHSKACHFLQQLLNSPEELHDHMYEYTVSVVLNSTYDYDPVSRKDELVEIVTEVLEIVVPAVRPDISLILGAFPLLFNIPSWFPGMSFKRQMASARVLSKRYLEQPFQYSLQRMTSGNLGSSMMGDALRKVEENGILPEGPWKDALKKGTGSALLAASETSHAVLLTFFLMMLVNPTAQEKAQAQIDAVVGRGRLPTMDDRPLLPYVDAIFREMLRYSPTVPLSVPHATVDNDVYNGFYIPKGAMVLTNLWSMGHDEVRFPNPDAFIPERFLNEDGSLKPNEVEHIAFGFGRRICVGRYFADTSVWSVMSKVLAVFKILRPLDENGREIEVEPKFTSGLTVAPAPFRYRIVPRFPEMDAEKLEQLIAASA